MVLRPPAAMTAANATGIYVWTTCKSPVSRPVKLAALDKISRSSAAACGFAWIGWIAARIMGGRPHAFALVSNRGTGQARAKCQSVFRRTVRLANE